MSYRNPFVTSYLRSASLYERELIGAVLRRHFTAVVSHDAYFFSGLHRRAFPGALQMEELEQLTEALRANEVKTPFCIVFAGEAEADQITFVYEP